MFKVSFAKTENLPLISEYEHDNFMGEAYSLDYLSEIIKDNYILKDNDNIFTINIEDEVVGYIIFHISKDFTDIYKIYIREKNRRNGYGKKLIKEVEKMAKRFNSSKLMIEVRSKNDNAINFYKKLGYKKISVRNDYYQNPSDDAIIFEKLIGDVC